MYGGQSKGVCCGGADHSLLHWGVYVRGSSGESRQRRWSKRFLHLAKERCFDCVLKVCGVAVLGIRREGEIGVASALDRHNMRERKLAVAGAGRL